MNKLHKHTPIPGINSPGKIEMIIDGLFPTRSPQNPEDRQTTHVIDNENATITIDELRQAARVLKSKIAPGPDGIPNEVIKHIIRRQPNTLLDTMNKCLAEGCFPKIWKRARLVLLRKGDKPLDIPSSYRPLCLLDIAGKLLAKIIDNRLRRFMENNSTLSDQQYGFRRGRSTTDAMMHLKEIAGPPSAKIKT